MTLAAAGVPVDILKDRISLCLHAFVDDIRAALAGLRMAPVPAGYRGGTAADMTAPVGTILRLQGLFLATPQLAEIEINPLFAGVAGTTIVDALIHVTD